MKILCVSLGCDKNLVDTEMMLGLLNRDGHTFTDDENEADIIVINTCCFINDAKEESVNTILEMAELKKTGKCKALIVTGCMAPVSYTHLDVYKRQKPVGGIVFMPVI